MGTRKPAEKTLFALACALALGGSAAASDADIYAVSQGTRAIVRVDPATGAQSVVSSGGLLATGFPMGVTAAANGDLFITHNGGEGGSLFRILPGSGAQSVVASGFPQAAGLTTEASGAVLLTDLNANNLTRVDPATGTFAVVSSGGLLSGPLGIGRAASGEIVVASRNNGRIVRIHPTTGAQTLVSEAGVLGNPQWLAVHPSGDVFVTTGNAVVRIDTTGAQSLLASGGALFSPRGIAVDGDGHLVVANGNNRILRVNAGTGAVTEISPGAGSGIISGTAGLAVAPPPPPVAMVGSSVTTIAAGSNVMWGVRADGTVAQWQSNVGSVPAGLANVRAIAGGNRFALALRADGSLVAWGQDPFSYGVLNVPAGLSDVVAMEGGEQHAIALRAAGTVVVWGDASNGQGAIPPGLTAVAIGAGDYHNLAVRGDGTVAAWGANPFGQTNVPAGLSGVVGVAGGSRHSLALKSNGSLVAWGANFFGEGAVPSGVSGITAIAAGWYHNLGLRADGTVVGWGHNDYGQATVPAGLNNVVSIAAGAYTSMALRSDGSLVVWGFDPFGSIQPPANTTFKLPGAAAPDTTPPVLSLPAPITVLASGPSGSVVTYVATASDDTDPAPVVSCSPASGSTFPIGQTTVECTASDASANVSSGSFTVAVTVTSASVTVKGSRLRANGNATLNWRITGPATDQTRNGDGSFTLVPGTYTVDVPGQPIAQAYGTFAVDDFGQVVNPTGSLTAAGNVVDFDLGLLAGVAIPVGHLTTDIAKGGAVLDLSGVSALVNGANPVFYLPPSLAGASYRVSLRASGVGVFGRFRVRADLTLEDLDLTDPLVVVEDGSGPGGGGRLDFDLSRLYPFAFPYEMADFGDPDSAGRMIGVGIADAAGFSGPATVYLPANVGATSYRMVTRTGGGLYGTFVVAPDLTPQQATGAVRFDASQQFSLDFEAMVPVTLRVRPLARPFVPLNLGNDDFSLGDDFTVYLPPNQPAAVYRIATAFGSFTIAPDLSVQTSGSLRLAADGRTINFDSCALTALHVSPVPGRSWRVAVSASGGFYTSYTSAATTLFLPDGAYTAHFNDGSSISVTLAGGAITTASPGFSVSGGSVSLGTCDDQPPVLSLPADFTVAATNAAGAAVTYAASAADNVDASPAVSCSPASGSTFPLGVTTVSCTASDASGNTASGSFAVTVADQDPPMLTLPADITTPSTSPAGAVASFSVTATDAIDPAPSVACSAASGSTFPIGLTTVSCSATDASGNAASGSFTVGVTVSSASVTIRGGQLRPPTTNLFWRLTGPGTNLLLNGDATRTLTPGTYQITVTNAEPYGTFTLDSFGQVVSPTGALTGSGNTVDFDLARLAKVIVAVEHLSSDPGTPLTLSIGVSNLVRPTSPFYYLPPNLPGQFHTVQTRSGHGTFGTFSVNADLSLGPTTGSVIVAAGPSGPQIDFDLAALTAVELPAAMELWEPLAAASLRYGITELLGKIENFATTPTIYLPPSSTPTIAYIVRTEGGGGQYGTFRVENDGSIGAVTGALQFASLGFRSWRMSFDKASLPAIELRVRSLSQPFHLLQIGLLSEGRVFDDATVYLPPNAAGASYQFFANLAVPAAPFPSFGTLTVGPDLGLAATGSLRVGSDGRTVDFDVCRLNGIRVSPNPGFKWWLGLSSTSNYTNDKLGSGTARTIFLPDGTYTISSEGDGAITVTLAGGSLVSATPGMNVAGGSVASAPCDNLAPVLSLPAGFSAPALTPAGATVSYSVTAADNVDPSPVVSCSPASGSLFPLGLTTVTCTATDAAGNSALGSFEVTVADQDPPALSVPADIVAEAASAAGAVVSYAASATDAIDSEPSVSCTPASGSTFPLGTTSVTCTATDAAGNSAQASFDVTVRDTTAPLLTPPAALSVGTNAGCGYSGSIGSASASDAVSSAAQIVVASDAPAAFAVGATLVTWTATDAAGNSSSATQVVTVSDQTPPSILACPAGRTLFASATSGGVAAPDLAAELAAADNCGVFSVVQNPAAGSELFAGETSVTLTIRDASGNAAACAAPVRVIDRAIPSDDRIKVHFQRPKGGSEDEDCGESDDDDYEPDGSQAPRTRCFTRLESHGEMRLRNTAKLPVDVRGPGAAALDARLRLSLSGRLVAEQAVVLDVKDAHDERWEWKRAGGSPRTGLGRLKLDWKESASYDSQRVAADATVPRLVTRFIGYDETDLKIEHRNAARPYTLYFNGPGGAFTITVHNAAGQASAGPAGDYGLKTKKNWLEISLPFRLTPETEIAFSSDGGATRVAIPVDPETNYSPAAAKYTLEVDKTALSDALCDAEPPQLTSLSEPRLEIELRLGSGPDEVVAIVSVGPGEWTKLDDRHWKKRP